LNIIYYYNCIKYAWNLWRGIRFRIPFEGREASWNGVFVKVKRRRTTINWRSLSILYYVYTTTHHDKLEVVIVLCTPTHHSKPEVVIGQENIPMSAWNFSKSW